MFNHKFTFLSAQSPTQDPPQTIHQAVASKDIQTVVALIKAGVDLNVQDERGRTPLHVLAYLISDEDSDSLEIIKLLLEGGADPNREDQKWRTPLLIAARRKKPGMVDTFLAAKEINVNSVDLQGRSPLFHAVEYSNYFDDEEERFREEVRNLEDTSHEKAEHIVKALLSNGADPNGKDGYNNTPLHAVFQAENLNSAIARHLLEGSADPNARNGEGDTPLHVLAHSFLDVDSHMAELLLEKGADPNVQNEKGQTPLHMAALGEKWDLVNILLLSKKIDVNIPNKFGDTPLFRAFDYHEGWQEGIIEALLARGANPNHPNEDGDTVLHICARTGDIYITEMLIQHGAEVNVRNKAGETPLYSAIIVGDIEVVRFLIEKGANVNTECNEGYTPLYLAATGWFSYYERGNETEHRPLFDMVKLLLDKRGDYIDWKDEAYRKKLWNDITDERIKELLVPVFQKAAMRDLWRMETENYESYFQWLPRELVEDIEYSFFKYDRSVKRKRTDEQDDLESAKRSCPGLV